MTLRREQEEFYRKLMVEVKHHIEDVEEEIETEIQDVRDRLLGVQEQKRNLQTIYKGMSKLIGIEDGMDGQEKAQYRRAIEELQNQIEGNDQTMEAEIGKARARLAEIQDQKKSLKMIYAGLAGLLGVENDLKEDKDKTQLF